MLDVSPLKVLGGCAFLEDTRGALSQRPVHGSPNQLDVGKFLSNLLFGGFGHIETRQVGQGDLLRSAIFVDRGYQL